MATNEFCNIRCTSLCNPTMKNYKAGAGMTILFKSGMWVNLSEYKESFTFP